MRLRRLVSGFLLSIASIVISSGAICSEAELRVAVAQGGMITFECDTQIVLSAPLQVTTNVVLDATGREVTISGGNTVRVFEVAEGVSFTVRNLRIIDGRVMGEAGSIINGKATHGTDVWGGAIAATNSLLLIQSCVFSNNFAVGGPGVYDSEAGHWIDWFAWGGKAFGGAVYASGGAVTVIDSEFLQNKALAGVNRDVPFQIFGDSYGGAIWASNAVVQLDRAKFENNLANAGGGAIHSANSAISVANSTFAMNSVELRFIYHFYEIPSGNCYGGAVDVRSPTSAIITNCIFLDNQLVGGGGFGSPPMPPMMSGGAIFSDGVLEVYNSEFIRNGIKGGGGGWAPSDPLRGGAICCDAELIVTESRFLSNTVVGDGPHFFYATRRELGRVYGGALYSSKELEIAKSSFIANIVRSGYSRFAGFGDPQGSAIFASNSILATNITIALNESNRHFPGEPKGAALFLGGSNAGLSHQIEFCTFATNRALTSELYWDAPDAPRDLHITISSNAVVRLRSNILAGGTTNTLVGSFIDEGYNISSDHVFTEDTSKNATDAKLGPVGIFGGRTETIPVLVGSPAIDAVSDGIPATDQRGRARPHGDGAEVGAYEISPPYMLTGKFRDQIDFSAIHLIANGERITVDDTSGRFFGTFLSTGSLRGTIDGMVFHPEEIPLQEGVELFDLRFSAYRHNEVAAEASGTGLIITFAAQTNGNYELQSSSDLVKWDMVESRTVAAETLFRIKLSSVETPQFFRAMQR